MNKKAVILLMTTGLTMAGCQGGSASGSTGDSSSSLSISEAKKYDLKGISYEKTSATQKTKDSQIRLSLSPIRNYAVGDSISVNATIASSLPSGHSYAYYIVDWGDGTWSYLGPKSATSEKKAAAVLTHKYRSEGTYGVKASAVDLSSGDLYGWSNSEELVISGDSSSSDPIIDTLTPISSSNLEDAEKTVDGKDTYWTSDSASDSDKPEWVGQVFDDTYKLSSVEIKFPKLQAEFACNIALEYTTDFGKTWYSLPKYYYLYDYSINRYSPIMGFPNPLGATLVFDMDGIVANGVRFSSKLFLSEARIFSVEEIRSYGNKDLLLYSSYDNTYNADINNMWTVFGSAKTEPVVAGSIAGESTNTSPFRTGCAMIASTEWLEWTGLKFNWTDDSEIKNTYLNQILNTKYGPDGWSNYEGYIYATADSAQHLGVQNHYVYNSIFILALRNYLLQANNTKIETEDGIIDIMDATNNNGQTISDRLEKAMSYMLTALEGESGILTINDPRNDGTTSGVSSNYWDVYRCFGYKSAYENTLFYGSLLAMADIKTKLGLTAEAKKYTDLAAKAKTAFNKLFWDESKGRYITSVNVDGERLDFGITFVNFMAVKYGLASEEQSKLIYSWIDGSRIIDADTSKGSDIYDEFVFSARSNTVDVSTITDKNGKYYWWDHSGALPCTPGTFGGYGHQMQNGGTIFYTSYYDIMGRFNSGESASANARLNTIMGEFHKDSLRRNRYMSFIQNGYNGIGEYSEGVMGEFPESGLVPYTFIEGLLGLKTTFDGLHIESNLPSDMSYAGIREYRFGNQLYSIQVNKTITEPSVSRTKEKIFVKLPASKAYTITVDGHLLEK